MEKAQSLEEKVRQVIQVLTELRRENHRLKTEVESLRGHVAMLSTENTKAQRILAHNEQLKKVHDQVTTRVERALGTLNALRSAS